METRMWQHLKTSKNVLWDFYYIYEQRWAHIYMDQLMELTGKTERQISDILQKYRALDHQQGIRVPIQKYTPTQTYYLKKAYRESRYAGRDKTTYLVQKTRLLRNQISTWFSKQRSDEALKISSTGSFDLKMEKSTAEYFSIANVLSDTFKY
ncbi:unnamed protein product [Caenorhabditis nigoni]